MKQNCEIRKKICIENGRDRKAGKDLMGRTFSHFSSDWAYRAQKCLTECDAQNTFCIVEQKREFLGKERTLVAQSPRRTLFENLISLSDFL